MTEKNNIVDAAVEKGHKSISALGITGIGATLLVVIIVLAQASGGIKLLGDWTDKYKQSAKSELIIQQSLQNLKEEAAKYNRYNRQHCQSHRDNGDKWQDCSKL